MDNQQVIDTLNKKRLRAFRTGVASVYAAYNTYLGINPEDSSLHESGIHSHDFRNQLEKIDIRYSFLTGARTPKQSELEDKAQQASVLPAQDKNVKDRDYYEKIARIACSRFGECQRGESIGVREIKRKLSSLREAGYEVKPYGQMNKQELWGYLRGVRAEIYRVLESNYPDIKNQIDSLNQSSKMSRNL